MNRFNYVLVALCMIVTAMAERSFAGTLITNINGYTASQTGIQQFSALVIDDAGRIAAVGDETAVRAYATAHPEMIADTVDVRQRTVLPGIHDAHAHVHGLGQLMNQLNLAGSLSKADAVSRISAYSEQRPHAEWILGRGWNQELWPLRQFPSASDIDAVVPDKPVWLRRVDGHAGWANSAALRIAGITDDTPDPVGGKIIRDGNGRATGVLIDRAMDSVSERVPTTDSATMRADIEAAASLLLSEGITAVHDAGISKQNVDVYLSMADDGELPLRIYAMLRGTGDLLDAVGEPLRAYGNGMLDIASVKIYADGALGSRGAAMLAPYSDDDENRGLSFWTQQQLTEQVRKANSMSFQVGVHAIGDAANQMALNAFAAVQGGKPSALRNRIEHAQIIAIDDLPRFAQLGVIASVQATHATSDKNMAEDRVGPERIRGGYAWRTLLDSGAIVANGSDFPVELSNPFHGLYASVTRQDRNGQPPGGWFKNEALTRAEALNSFTLAVAKAANNESTQGSLEVGKWADFIIIDRDYFVVPDAEIDDIKVLETWVGGHRQFVREADAR